MIPAGMPMGFLDKFLDWHVIYFVDYNRQNRHVFTGYNRCMGVEAVKENADTTIIEEDLSI